MIYYKKIYIYRESDLPNDGWFQSCFNCYTITSRTIKYKKIRTTYYLYDIAIYVCPYCKNLFKIEKNKEQKFINKCNYYIKHKLILV